MANYRCWDPDDCNEDGATAIVNRSSSESAAEEFAAKRYDKDDYPEKRTVCVRDEQGDLTRWIVTAEPSVNFVAWEER